MTYTESGATGRISRRDLIGSAGVLGAGALLGGLAACGSQAGRPRGVPGGGDATTVPFYRRDDQAGIIDPYSPQAHLVFASFSVTTSRRDELAGLLRRWTESAAALCGYRSASHPSTAAPRPALENPSRLTLTLGYGPSLFDGRFGLAGRQPASLLDLPPLPLDNLDPARSGGDLCVQACSDDARVASGAVDTLTGIGSGIVTPRWEQIGFANARTRYPPSSTPRNLIGFKDGTHDIQPGQTELLDDYLRVGSASDQAWMVGGTYLVFRKIEVALDRWNSTSVDQQEKVIGRSKASGAPLSGGGEFDLPDFDAKNRNGDYVIPYYAHIRLAATGESAGFRIQRRSYNYVDADRAPKGTASGGTVFICFANDPQSFIELQLTIGGRDALSPFLSHIGSAVFACPPGIEDGEHWGRSLFT